MLGDLPILWNDKGIVVRGDGSGFWVQKVGDISASYCVSAENLLWRLNPEEDPVKNLTITAMICGQTIEHQSD